MANSKLQHKIFKVPDKILNFFNEILKKYSDKNESKGFNRAIFILNRKQCTYEQLKRIKNYFDGLNDENFDEVEYLLNGGDLMRKWVNFKLDEARKMVKGTKTVRKNSGQSNQFRKDSEETVNPVTPTIKKVPEFMTNNDLMEEINKIKTLNKKLI